MFTTKLRRQWNWEVLQMPINGSYSEEAVVSAIATALDNFYTTLILNERKRK
jgi:hypothetical protein